MGDLLLSENDVRVREGIDIVSSWRIRGRVPVGVEATALLVETVLAYVSSSVSINVSIILIHISSYLDMNIVCDPLVCGCRDRHGLVSEALVRLQYSLAIVRLVNGVADSSQKGKVAFSVASLAKQYGLPRLLVDLRHESTHNELPSLQVLRIAAQHGLAWLKERYWKAQDVFIEDSYSKIAEISWKYVQSHKDAVAKATNNAKRMRIGGDLDDEGHATHDNEVPAGSNYDPKQSKKDRLYLLNELKTLVPKACGELLIPGLFSFPDVTMPDEESHLLCARVLDHLENEWPDIANIILLKVMCLYMDSLFDKESGVPAIVHVWRLVTMDCLEKRNSQQTILAILDDIIDSYNDILNRKKIEWCLGEVELGSDRLDVVLESMEHLMTHVPSTNRERIQRFISSNLDCFKIRNIEMEENAVESAMERKNPVSQSKVQPRVIEENSMHTGWARVQSWHPCAIGNLPSLIFHNGKTPMYHGEKGSSWNGLAGTNRPVKIATQQQSDHSAVDYKPPTGTRTSMCHTPAHVENESAGEGNIGRCLPPSSFIKHSY